MEKITLAELGTVCCREYKFKRLSNLCINANMWNGRGMSEKVATVPSGMPTGSHKKRGTTGRLTRDGELPLPVRKIGIPGCMIVQLNMFIVFETLVSFICGEQSLNYIKWDVLFRLHLKYFVSHL